MYKEAIEAPSYRGEACLCQVLDRKGQALAWAIYSPGGTLALRIISTEKKPPNSVFFTQRFQRAWQLRETFFDKSTNAYRIFNGEGDFLPGLVCDRYANVAVLQFDGKACFEFWDSNLVAEWLLENTPVTTVYFKPRFSDDLEPQWWGQKQETPSVEIVENAVKFSVDYQTGQKTGFFLDQRDNREYVASLAKGKSLLNLFSYTGGFSLYAGVGGATSVTSVDIAPEAIKKSEEQWALNELGADSHEGICQDVFEFVKGSTQKFDIVVVDPPSMTHSEKTKHRAMQSYKDLFTQAASLVKPGQHLVLSSCSSHISFNDFLEIIDEAMSASRKMAQIHRISGQGMDHPIPHFCRELRYLKFVHLRLQ